MIHQLTDKAIGVQVPQGSHGFMFSTEQLWLCTKPKQTWRRFFCELPEGNWKILGLGKDLTPSDKASIVEKENDGSGHLLSWWYREYITGAWVKDLHVSFATLLRSKGLQGDNTLILIKQ